VALTLGGLRSEQSTGPAIQDAMIDAMLDAMIRLDRAVKPFVAELRGAIGPDGE
jgi:hypothetical protein